MNQVVAMAGAGQLGIAAKHQPLAVFDPPEEQVAARSP